MKVIKRNGSEVTFDLNKIKNAMLKANKSVLEKDMIDELHAESIAKEINDYVIKSNSIMNVENIQDLVELKLMESGYYRLAQEYVRYRHNRTLLRKGSSLDSQILSMVDLKNQEVLEENSNKNPIIISTQRDYMAGLCSKNIVRTHFLSQELRDAHDNGLIHIHDMDYLVAHSTNCSLINLEDMLQNGTVISETLIEKPHSFYTACNVTTQIIAQVSSSQWGGTSITLSHIAPFVDISRKNIKREVKQEYDLLGLEYDDKLDQIVENRLKDEIKRGIQTIQYQILTLSTTNGQSPFITVFMYLNEVKDEQTKKDLVLIIEEVLKQRIQGVKNKSGAWIAPTFPKLIYVLEEDNYCKGSKYYYLTELAAKCTSKRMVPDYISEKKMFELKEGNCFPAMGCRSMLAPYKTSSGSYKFYGRFNFGVCTLNLVDAACSSNKDLDKFWKILEERAELCHSFLRSRYEYMKDTPSDVAPILWQHGALARLKSGEKIGQLLINGYASASLGYAGLWETVYYLIGEKLTSEKGKALGLKIMQKLNEFVNKWKANENIGYSIYGTPKQPWVA